MNVSGNTLTTDKDIHRPAIMNVPVAITLERIGHEVPFMSHDARLLEMIMSTTERNCEMTDTTADAVALAELICDMSWMFEGEMMIVTIQKEDH